jgi:hypothetical protein
MTVMHTALDELLEKVRAVAASPRGDLLRQIVELMYEGVEGGDSDEILSSEDSEAITRGSEDIKQGRYITLEELERKFNL